MEAVIIYDSILYSYNHDMYIYILIFFRPQEDRNPIKL